MTGHYCEFKVFFVEKEHCGAFLATNMQFQKDVRTIIQFPLRMAQYYGKSLNLPFTSQILENGPFNGEYLVIPAHH